MRQPVKDTEFFTVVSLSSDIYAALAKPGTGAWSNAGFVDLGNEVLVFDAMSTPKAARKLREVATELIGKPIKYLVNSHYHGDHTFGNQVFSDTAIFSTQITRDLIKKHNAVTDVAKEHAEMQGYLINLQNRRDVETDAIALQSLNNQIAEMIHVAESLDELQLTLPNVIFENHLTIHGSKRNVYLYCLGGGHTASDTVLYLPDEKILFSGDLAVEHLHPPIYHFTQFNSIVRRLKEEFEIAVLVPGHGKLCDNGHLDILIDYFGCLNEMVQDSMQFDDPVMHLESKETPHAFRFWTGVDGFKRNLKAVFELLNRQG